VHGSRKIKPLWGEENAGHEEAQHMVSSVGESVDIDLGIGGAV
jgi:hypothetical protein